MGPRLRLPPYVHVFTDRHGRARFYFRRAGFKRVALPGLPYSPEFMTAHDAAMHGTRAVLGVSRSRPGTVAAAVAGYFASSALTMLAETTQRTRRRILERFRLEHGDKSIAGLGRIHVERLLAAKTAANGMNFLVALRSAWAASMCATALFTCARVRPAPRWRSRCIPSCAALEATPAEQLTFLTTHRGRPFHPDAFTHWFKGKCREAGLPAPASVHGLRKAACRRLAELGCSASVIAAISGHSSLREITRYTAAADQVRLARQGIEALSGTKIGKPGRLSGKPRSKVLK